MLEINIQLFGVGAEQPLRTRVVSSVKEAIREEIPEMATNVKISFMTERAPGTYTVGYTYRFGRESYFSHTTIMGLPQGFRY